MCPVNSLRNATFLSARAALHRNQIESDRFYWVFPSFRIWPNLSGKNKSWIDKIISIQQTISFRIVSAFLSWISELKCTWRKMLFFCRHAKRGGCFVNVIRWQNISLCITWLKWFTLFRRQPFNSQWIRMLCVDNEQVAFLCVLAVNGKGNEK